MRSNTVTCFVNGTYHIFQTIRHSFLPLAIWEENGGASYSQNVAYLAHWGRGGAVVEWVIFFFPIFLL